MEPTLTISNEEVSELAELEDACNEFILLATKLRCQFDHLSPRNESLRGICSGLHVTTGMAINDACAVVAAIDDIQRRVIGITE